MPGPSPGEWSSIRGIGAYRSLGYSSRNVIVKCYIWSGNLPLGFTRCNAIQNVVVKMAAYLLNGNQPPLIIALECEIEKKEGPDLPSQRENYDQDKITMLVL